MTVRIRRNPVAIVAVLVGGIVLGGIAFWWLSAAFLYKEVDPAPYRFNATILNNTPGTVVLRGCEPQGCAIFYEPTSLQPDEKVDITTSADDSPHWWVISDRTGETMGCLNLQFTKKVPDLVVPISNLQLCSSGTPQHIPPPNLAVS